MKSSELVDNTYTNTLTNTLYNWKLLRPSACIWVCTEGHTPLLSKRHSTNTLTCLTQQLHQQLHQPQFISENSFLPFKVVNKVAQWYTAIKKWNLKSVHSLFLFQAVPKTWPRVSFGSSCFHKAWQQNPLMRKRRLHTTQECRRRQADWPHSGHHSLPGMAMLENRKGASSFPTPSSPEQTTKIKPSAVRCPCPAGL